MCGDGRFQLFRVLRVRLSKENRTSNDIGTQTIKKKLTCLKDDIKMFILTLYYYIVNRKGKKCTF